MLLLLLLSELDAMEEVVGETGRLVEAAVEGLRSWAESGWCFMEADWMVEAISMAGFDILGGIVVVNVVQEWIVDSFTTRCTLGKADLASFAPASYLSPKG